jgi:hypothetical protein
MLNFMRPIAVWALQTPGWLSVLSYTKVAGSVFGREKINYQLYCNPERARDLVVWWPF